MRIAGIIIVVIFISILIFAYIPVGMGSTGIRPKTHNCIGLTIDRFLIHRILPSARIEIGPFAYYVDKISMSDWVSNYCLGRDIWYGE